MHRVTALIATCVVWGFVGWSLLNLPWRSGMRDRTLVIAVVLSALLLIKPRVRESRSLSKPRTRDRWE